MRKRRKSSLKSYAASKIQSSEPMHKDSSVRAFLVFDFTPRSSEASEWNHQIRSSNRQGSMISSAPRPYLPDDGGIFSNLIAELLVHPHDCRIF
jgi:hypothetical protein